MVIQKGGQNCTLLLLPYISINSSNDIQTDGFSNTHQKQSLWTSIIYEYARPNIYIKINGKDFLVSSILDLILLLFPNIYGPNLGLYREFLAKLQEFLKPKYNKSIKIFKCILMRDQKCQPTTLQPYVIDAPLNLIGRDSFMQ